MEVIKELACIPFKTGKLFEHEVPLDDNAQVKAVVFHHDDDMVQYN